MGRNPSGSATPTGNASAMAVKGVRAAFGGGQQNGEGETSANAGGDYLSSQATPQAGMSTSGGAAETGRNDGGQYEQNDGNKKGGFSLLKLLTCRCG